MNAAKTVPIEMPQLSSDGESATLAAWLVGVGDRVEAGEVIAELETDKSTIELEAPSSGTLVELKVTAGTENVAPGSILGAIEPAGAAAGASGAESPLATTPTRPTPPTPPTTPATPATPKRRAEPPPSDPTTPTTPTQQDDRGDELGLGSSRDSPRDSPRGSTPLARRAAADRGLDLSHLEGSGPGGRIVQADVMDAGSPPTTVVAEVAREIALDAEQGFESVRLSAMRKTIARRMTEAKQQIPHFYLRMRCSMDSVFSARTRLNAALAESGSATKLSINDFIVKAAALALRDVPAANVRFAGDAMHLFDRVDIAIAVATEGGLVTPVVRDADRKSLTALAEETTELARKARDGQLLPAEYQGGTFTISNLGMYGIETVYPILNPPQACILGVGAAEEQPVVREGQVVVGRIAAMTLAADHRAVDGAVGARLLAALRLRMEDPLGMML